MTAQTDPLIAVADQFHLTAAEVTDALAALRSSKTRGAVEQLRATMISRAHDAVAGVHDPEKVLAIADDRILEIQQAAINLRMVSGLDTNPVTPSGLLQKKVRSLQAHVDHVKTALAQAAASPQQARYVRDSRATLPELWAAIDALSEVR